MDKQNLYSMVIETHLIFIVLLHHLLGSQDDEQCSNKTRLQCFSLFEHRMRLILEKRDVYEPDAAKEQMKYLIRVY